MHLHMQITSCLMNMVASHDVQVREAYERIVRGEKITA